jgi:hypothetical protein
MAYREVSPLKIADSARRKGLLEAALNDTTMPVSLNKPNQEGIARQAESADPMQRYKENTRHGDTLHAIGEELDNRLFHVTRTPSFIENRSEVNYIPDPTDPENPRKATIIPKHDPEAGVWQGRKATPVANAGPEVAGIAVGIGDNPRARLAPAVDHMNKFWDSLELHQKAHDEGRVEDAMAHITSASDHLVNAMNAASASRLGDEDQKVGLPTRGKRPSNVARAAGRSGLGILSDKWATQDTSGKSVGWATGDKGSALKGIGVSLEKARENVQTILGAYRRHVSNTVGLPESAYYNPRVAGGRIYTPSFQPKEAQESESNIQATTSRVQRRAELEAAAQKAASKGDVAGVKTYLGAVQGVLAKDEVKKATAVPLGALPPIVGLDSAATVPTKPREYDDSRLSHPIINPKNPWKNPKMSLKTKGEVALKAKQAWEKNNPGEEFYGSPAYADHEGYLAKAGSGYFDQRADMAAVAKEHGEDATDVDKLLAHTSTDEEEENYDVDPMKAAPRSVPLIPNREDLASLRETAAKSRLDHFNEAKGQ